MSTYVHNSKPIKIHCSTHDDWLNNREDGIGSSDIATLLGLNPFETPYQLWQYKTGKLPPKTENFFMKAGHYLEDAVAKFYEDESGRKVINNSSCEDIYVHPNYSWARVSPDRLFWLDEKRSGDNKGILECKTTQKEIDRDNLPPYWFTQVQYQLGVMGRTHASLAWLSHGRSFDYSDIDFVPDYFDWIMGEAEAFYTKYIVADAEPLLVNSADVISKFPVQAMGTFVEADDQLIKNIEHLKTIKESIKDLETQRDNLEGAVKLFMGEAESLDNNGDVLATWKAPKPSMSFDKKRFESENPDIYKKYLVSINGSRRLLIK